MADVHDKATRSYNMSQIKGKDTKPEIIVRKFLFSNGFRYKLHDKKLPGRPDIVLPKYKTVIFVQGCFWHGHKGCKYFVIPKTRTDFWVNKIEGNQKRDVIKFSQLKELNWNVFLIYECELKKDNREETFNNLLKFLKEKIKH